MMMNPFFFLRIWRFDTRPLVLLGGLVEASSLVQKAAAFLDDDHGKKRFPGFFWTEGEKEREREFFGFKIPPPGFIIFVF